MFICCAMAYCKGTEWYLKPCSVVAEPANTSNLLPAVARQHLVERQVARKPVSTLFSQQFMEQNCLGTAVILLYFVGPK